ncbi:MAG TPA: GNAT family N-acetyltransferase [Pseudonocardiaceae bacterium]|nr:GNAT family N-acetyltransferase [Pseudonocardiaceae bacterium]
MKIRQITADEQPAISDPLQVYGFEPSPPSASRLETLHAGQRYHRENVTLVAEDDGVTVAEATAIPMRQNVRGSVFSMAGIAGVASDPRVRRQGHVRRVLLELLGRMRDEGCAVSALYPFKPSFYQRFGFVGTPQVRTVTFSPAGLSELLRTELAGEIRWEAATDGYAAYRDFTRRLLGQRHGFAVLPDSRTVRMRDANERWIVTARVAGEVVGALAYRITDHGGDLIGDDLLATSALGRALVLRFIAGHADQVASVALRVSADETPELWATDLAATITATTAVPIESAPMARVLSVTALNGMAVGAGSVAIEIVDDPFIAGRYVLDGRTGVLETSDHPAPTRPAAPTARLTAAGFSGLVYGVLSPEDVLVRGLGTVPPDAAAELAALFPRRSPDFFAHF